MIKLLSHKEKKNFYLLILLYSFFSILEVLNISLIFPIIENFLDNQGNKSFYFTFLTNMMGEKNSLIKILLLFLSLFIFKNIYFILITYFQNNFIFNFKSKVSSEVFNHLINSELTQFNIKNSSSYLKNIIGDTTQVAQCIGMLIVLFSDFLVLFFVFLMLMMFNFKITILVFFLLGMVLIIYFFFFKKKFKILGTERYIKEEKLYKLLNNSLGSFTEIKLFNKEKYFTQLFDANNSSYINVLKKYDFLQAIPRAFFELFGISIIVISIIIAKLNSELDIINYLPLISIFSLCLIRLMPIFNRITISVQNIRYGKQTVDILYNELKKHKIIKRTNLIDSKFKIKEDDKINIQNLGFKINNYYLFKNINLTLSLSDKIGIYGESGSGKSSLLKVFSGLIKPNDGGIYINDINILNHLDEWQKNIAFLKQDNFILDGTIKNNICFGENLIDEKKLEEAINKSNLENIIKKFPMGLNKEVGENGNKISGGERQRICIARSLYFDKKILIFDEPTASLDKENEREIINCINLINNKMIILISHNKKNFKGFDKVFKLEDEKLIIED